MSMTSRSVEAVAETCQRLQFGQGWSTQRLAQCCGVRKEPLFDSVVTSLFAEGLIPPGSIVDAGANLGTESCFFSVTGPNRTIHAIDPLQVNINFIQRRFVERRRRHSIIPLLGGLGSISKTLAVPLRKSSIVGGQISIAPESARGGTEIVANLLHGHGARLSLESNQTFPVEPLDVLFTERWRDERLGFGHFDVEGGELELLRGASATLLRDRPTFIFECHVHVRRSHTTALLRFVESLDYVIYLLDEECGWPLDCRNFLAVSRGGHEQLTQSRSMSFYLANGRMLQVNSTSIFQHAYPFCGERRRSCMPSNRAKELARTGKRLPPWNDTIWWT